MNSQVSMKNTLYQPIQDMNFNGLHWIEASAGTGKTYTLSSLMVRIFLSGYLPQQVVATTFTRAAAAELKGRIRQRLRDSLHYFEALRGYDARQMQQQLAEENDVLYQKLLQDYANKPEFVCHRLGLVLNQLDDLFVGTLDSFSQKLLREFSFESGKTETLQITEDAKQYYHQLAHDVLREWIDQQPQYLIDLLVNQKVLQPTSQYLSSIEQSLNFASAQFESVNFGLNEQHYAEAINVLAALSEADCVALQSYYQGEYLAGFSNHVSKNDNLAQIFQHSLLRLIAAAKLGWQQYLNTRLHVDEKKTFSLFLTEKGTPRKSIFNKPNAKCPQEVQAQFFEQPAIQAIRVLIDATQAFQQQMQLMKQQLHYYLALQVKQRLPNVLQQYNETTFAQQIRILAQALQSAHGQQFAHVIHHRYPLILVDEFQDTNHDQDQMLAQIWRNRAWYAQGCMIMVGDPKQAIYGFRGGDMLTYNNAKADVLAKQGKLYSLVANHRSVAELVAVVDELFQRQSDFGEQVSYTAIAAGSRAHAPLLEAGYAQANPYPLRWLALVEKQSEEQQVAWQISQLLHQAQQGDLYLAEPTPRAIQAEDIAVLSTGHNSLDQLQYELQRLGVAVNRASKRSVFDSFLATEVAALLTAILHPYDEGRVKRALLSHLLGFNLSQLNQLQQDNQLSQFMYDFENIREMWLHKGFLSAWQYCLNLFSVWEKLVQYQHHDNERVVVNLRHLGEILSLHSEYYQGPQALYQWYLKQLNVKEQRDWAIERRLSQAEGVQLMTIHASKGLEFKIVFLMGANKGKTDKESIFNFSTQIVADEHTGQGAEQRILMLKDPKLDGSAHALRHQERHLSEQKRLWYVALTRASHRVYAVLPKLTKTVVGALLTWRDQPCVNAELVSSYSQDIQPLSTRPATLQVAKIQAIELQAQALPALSRHFFATTHTSFTGLSQHKHFAQRQDQVAALEDGIEQADDEQDQVSSSIKTAAQPLHWLKQQFPKGATAGNFLHEIFEHIDFTDSSAWRTELHRRFNNDYPELWQQLKQKFQDNFALSTILQPILAPIYAQHSAWIVQLWQQSAQKNPASYALLRDALYQLAQQCFSQLQIEALYQQLQQYSEQLFAQRNHLQADAQFMQIWHDLAQPMQQWQWSTWQQQVTQELHKAMQKTAAVHAHAIEPHLEHALQRWIQHCEEDVLLSLMQAWLKQILATPLSANFQLNQLNHGSYLTEFPFYLALADQAFPIHAVQQLFAEQGIVLQALNPAHTARYLIGSIDLVYFDGQRYHIADYKSNYLGDDLQHYQKAGIENSMSEANYWLQAGLYLVALHRYLKHKLQNYQMAEHLGGATYLYLRGMNSTAQQGYQLWKPNDEFILQLDQLLGQAQMTQEAKYD